MLIEAITYVALLAVTLGLALGAFYVAFENNRNLTRNADDIARALRAGERWRADVREARSAPRFVTNAATSQIELHLPKETNAVVYTFHDGVMFRQAPGESNAVTLLDRVQRSEFTRDLRPHVTAWRWEVELEVRQRVARVRPLFAFQAVEQTKVKR
jgi:hypothetical protein